MSYHNGSVWPHDTIIAAEGMLHYGLVDSARTAAQGIIDAAAHFDNRLPELFGGFSREDFPLQCPTAMQEHPRHGPALPPSPQNASSPAKKTEPTKHRGRRRTP
jgi:hypothetical protein